MLVGDVDETLASLVEDAGFASLQVAGIDVKAEPGKAGVVSAAAEDYADERAAELVGMRYDELGRLVENPDAEWAITDSTRDFLRDAVSDAITGGWSNQQLASAIGESYGFSKDRAMMIARTETSMAANRGALEGYKASGTVELVTWLTAGDDLVEEDCLDNEAAGAIPIGEAFPSGDDAPPAHPNCRCAIAPVVTLPTEEE